MNPEYSAIPDAGFAASSDGNESASSIEAPEEPYDSNSTTVPDIVSPRAFNVGPRSQTVEKLRIFSTQPPLVSSSGSFHQSSNPWFGPFHDTVYAGTDPHPYTYGDRSRGFPYYSYGGVHAAALPYGYSYGTAGSHYNYAPSTGGSPLSGYAYGMGGSSPQAYDRQMHVAPPYVVGRPPSYGYFPRQPSILDPELVLIGNFLMKVREMPLAQVWMTSEVPVSMTEKLHMYPSSNVMHSNKGYHRTRDLLSNNQYSNNDYTEPEPETLELQKQDVPETHY